jgi:hypothetical protein
MNMYRVQGTLREWVTRDEVRRFIAKKFKEFLLTYVNPKNDQGEIEYVRLINEMVLGIICFIFSGWHEKMQQVLAAYYKVFASLTLIYFFCS